MREKNKRIKRNQCIREKNEETREKNEEREE